MRGAPGKSRHARGGITRDGRREMVSVFELLDAIRQRPAMFVGGEASNRGDQLWNLELLLHGYALAIQAHQIEEPVKDFPREFAGYLQHKYNWSVAAGPIAAIREAAPDDEEAWKMFWRLVEEYRKSLGA
jgi:hypothetical protein